MTFLETWSETKPQSIFDFLNGDFDGLLSEFSKTGRQLKPWRLACDISEEKDHYVYSFDVPGVKKEDIKIEHQGGHLIVKGERSYESKGESKNYQRIERSYGKFQRAVSVPDGVDISKVDASQKDGQLILKVPKSEISRQIHIQ